MTSSNLPPPVPKVDLPYAAIMAEPIDHTAEGLRTWVSEVSRFLGLTPTELAKEAGLAASTLNRFLREGDGSLSAKTIKSILETAKKLEKEMVDGKRLIPEGAIEDRPYLVNVAVLGKANATNFDNIKAYTTTLYTLKIPIPRPFVFGGIGAYEVEDDHAAPEYPKGTIVIVTPTSRPGRPLPIEVFDQDHVVVFDSSNPDNRLKTSVTVRKVSKSPANEWWLLRFNRDFGDLPDAILGNRNNGLFLILGSYRPRHDVRWGMSKKALDRAPV